MRKSLTIKVCSRNIVETWLCERRQVAVLVQELETQIGGVLAGKEETLELVTTQYAVGVDCMDEIAVARCDADGWHRRAGHVIMLAYRHSSAQYLLERRAAEHAS